MLKKEKNFLFRIKRGDLGVLEESVEEGVYLTIKVTINITSSLCAKKDI